MNNIHPNNPSVFPLYEANTKQRNGNSYSISHVVKQRLSELDLAQIPSGAIEILTERLVSKVAPLARRVITAKTVSKAVLASASKPRVLSSKHENPKPQGLGVECSLI